MGIATLEEWRLYVEMGHITDKELYEIIQKNCMRHITDKEIPCQ